jgi:hypothetical protein
LYRVRRYSCFFKGAVSRQLTLYVAIHHSKGLDLRKYSGPFYFTNVDKKVSSQFTVF